MLNYLYIVEKKQMEYFNFSVDTEGLTSIIYNFFLEGNFRAAYLTLKDGGLDDSKIEDFYRQRLKLTGSGVDGDVFISENNQPLTDTEFNEKLFYAIETLISNTNFEFDDIFTDRISKNKEVNEQLEYLFKIIDKDRVRELTVRKFFYYEGYDVVEQLTEGSSGVILSNGITIELGYNEHQYLYEILYELGYADSEFWTDDSKVIHISSNQISGSLAYAVKDLKYLSDLSDNELARCKPLTTKQLKALFVNRHLKFYGSDDTIAIKSITNGYQLIHNCGGKYGKLQFLKDCYPQMNYPRIAKTPIDGVKNCIRTSLDVPMHGLVDSFFGEITKNTIKTIQSQWDEVKHICPNNKLHFFFQEYLDGSNGVAHLIDNEFKYSLSANQGDIVDGKVGTEKLSAKHELELKEFMLDLYNKGGENIQIEFVISDDKLFIVEMKYLETTFFNEDLVIKVKKEDVLFTGTSFSRGIERVNKNEVLYVTDDCVESKHIAGKKAVIVENETEFSHILALAASLKIPAIYGTGAIYDSLPDNFKINTTGKIGYILK